MKAIKSLLVSIVLFLPVFMYAESMVIGKGDYQYSDGILYSNLRLMKRKEFTRLIKLNQTQYWLTRILSPRQPENYLKKSEPSSFQTLTDI